MRNDVSLFAALSLAALTAASPALAETLTVTGIDHTGNVAHVVAPTVEVVDGNIDEATIQLLFSDGMAGAGASALAGLDAVRFSIPSMTLTKVDDDDKGPTTFEITNLVLTGVTDGVASGLSIEKLALSGGEDKSAGSIGPITLTDFNLAAMLTVAGVLPDAPAADEPLPLFGSLKVDNATFSSESGACNVDEMTSGPLAVRPLKSMPLAEGLALAERLENETNPATADIAKLMAFNADILTAYHAGAGEITGVNCSGFDDEGKAFVVEIKRLANADATTGVVPEMTVDGFFVQGDAVVMSLETLVVRPMEFAHVIAALQEIGDKADAAWLEANFRKLVPWFGGFGFAGLVLDVPAGEDQPGARVKVSLGDFDLTLGDYVNGVPSSIHSATTDLSIVVPPTVEGAEALMALGYDRLDLDFELNAHWDRDAKTIVIQGLSISEGISGTITLSATLGNATEDLFAEPPAQAMAAATRLTLKDVKIDVSDAGLLTKLLTIGAAEQKLDEPTFRAAMASVVQGTVLMGMGASPSSLQVAQAIQGFISGMPNLTLTATATDPSGVTLMDLQRAQNDPTQLLQKMDITAESSGTPAAPATETTPAEPAADPAPAAPAESEAPAADGGKGVKG